MLVGSHLSIAGGMHLAVQEAQRLELDCVQVFTKNQRQWKWKPLADEEIKADLSLGDNDLLNLAFAVTFDDAGTKKTFFVVLPMQRARRDDGKAEWQIFRALSSSEIEQM